MAEQQNPFDELGFNFDPEEIKKHNAEQEAINNRLDQLIHQTFAQTEPGAELLELWKESLMMFPGAAPGMDNTEIGINEGKKAFIRNIILTIRRVEND